jgi:hypothetical protein
MTVKKIEKVRGLGWVEMPVDYDPALVTEEDCQRDSQLRVLRDFGARVERAAEYTDAVELSDGRWAYYAHETCSWWTNSARDLAALCDYLDSDDESISRDAYSHWCAGTVSEEMPRGWTPGEADGADGYWRAS